MLSSLSLEDIWVMVGCSFAAIACAIPGVFLMLRRMSMLGDAVSHAVLPGIAGAFLLTGSRGIVPMFLGALTAGVGASLLASFLARRKLAPPDASLGIIFTSFFAIGVILVSWGARHVDIDVGCVLYGLAEFIPFDTVTIFGAHIPRAVLLLGVVALLNILLTGLFLKELVLTSFDPTLAHCSGISGKFVQNGLMIVTSITAVAAFESVGSVLVVAMFIIPAAAAYLFADTVVPLLMLTSVFAVASATGGYVGALHFNSSVAGMMSVVAGAIFFTSMFLSPRHGLLHRAYQRGILKVRIVRDDILGMLFRWHELSDSGSQPPLTHMDAYKALGYSPITFCSLLALRWRGHIYRNTQGHLLLTEAGLVEGSALIRSHRLWEAYLAKHLGLPLDHLHAPSERMEHYIGRALAREIESEVGSEKDPHGRGIPK